MHDRDASDRYLADVYARSLPAPELQWQWARDIDRAQRAFNSAIAGDPAACRCLIDVGRRRPGPGGAAHAVARWTLQEDGGDAVAGDANAQFEACLAALAATDATPARRASLKPLRLRVEFLNELVAALRESDDAYPATLASCVACVERIRAATARLVDANQRLVVVLARQYRNGPLAFMDLVQEGNLGLLRAIERFDPGHGTRVSTYAMWWVRRAMVYAIARQGRDVRPSVAQYWAAREVMRTQDRLEREHGRRVSCGEVAQCLGIPVAEVQRHLGTLAPALELDAPIEGAAELARVERLPGQCEKEPERVMCDSDLRRAIGELLAQLPERHARILRLRFGIGVREDCTLEQIARQQGVTRERIRQLEVQALKALRQLDSAWALRGSLG